MKNKTRSLLLILLLIFGATLTVWLLSSNQVSVNEAKNESPIRQKVLPVNIDNVIAGFDINGSKKVSSEQVDSELPYDLDQICSDQSTATQVAARLAVEGSSVVQVNRELQDLGSLKYMTPEGEYRATPAAEYYAELPKNDLETAAKNGNTAAMMTIVDNALNADVELDRSNNEAVEWSLELLKRGKLFGITALLNSKRQEFSKAKKRYGSQSALLTGQDQDSSILENLRALEKNYFYLDSLSNVYSGLPIEQITPTYDFIFVDPESVGMLIKNTGADVETFFNKAFYEHGTEIKNNDIVGRLLSDLGVENIEALKGLSQNEISDLHRVRLKNRFEQEDADYSKILEACQKRL